MFHPDRPYFVNLAYLHRDILLEILDYYKKFFSLNLYYDSDDVQIHYLKHQELFGPEEKLPGFLMTNQQMIEFIQVQVNCLNYQNGYKRRYLLGKGNSFNCPVDEDEYMRLLKLNH